MVFIGELQSGQESQGMSVRAGIFAGWMDREPRMSKNRKKEKQMKYVKAKHPCFLLSKECSFKHMYKQSKTNVWESFLTYLLHSQAHPSTGRPSEGTGSPGSKIADCPGHNPIQVNTQLLPSNVEALCLPQKRKSAKIRKYLWSSSCPTILLGAGSLQAGSPRPCQIGFWTSPMMDTPLSLWATCASIWPTSWQKDFFSCARGVSRVSVCACGLLPHYWASLRRICFSHPLSSINANREGSLCKPPLPKCKHSSLGGHTIPLLSMHTKFLAPFSASFCSIC